MENTSYTDQAKGTDFFKVVLLLCPYTAPDKFKDCFSVFKFFLVWTGLNIAHICKKLGHNLALNLIRKVWKNCLRILRSLSCAQSPVDLQETNPCGAECYTHVKVRSQLEMSKVIRDCHCFSLLRSVIGPQKLVPRSQPIRCKANTCHDLVTRVFPRFGPFTCFYFELSLVLQGIFLSFDWSM